MRTRHTVTKNYDRSFKVDGMCMRYVPIDTCMSRTSSMTHKKRVLLSLTSPGAVVQPLALEPVALEPAALEPAAADTSNVKYP
jgi:hypothetical protein